MSEAIPGLSPQTLPRAYAEAYQAVWALGLQHDPALPTQEQLEDDVQRHGDWLQEQIDRGQGAELLLVPSVQEIGLHGAAASPGLVNRFDRLQDGVSRTIIRHEVWDRLGDMNPAHDGESNQPWSAVVMLGDMHDPFAPSQAANEHGIAGLVHTNLTTAELIEALDHECKAADRVGLDLEAASLAAIFMAKVRRDQAMQPIFRQAEVVNMATQYGFVDVSTSVGMKWPDEGLRSPTIDFTGLGACLGSVSPDARLSHVGARRMVELSVAT